MQFQDFRKARMLYEEVHLIRYKLQVNFDDRKWEFFFLNRRHL